MAGFSMEDLSDEVVSDSYLRECPSCSANMKYMGSGRYVCEKCGEEYFSDFGKVKKYLEENGPQNAVTISRETGVSRWKIGKFLQAGRMEVAEDAGTFLYCQSCGTAIRAGKYCMDCMKKISERNGKGVFNGLADERQNQKGEMRFGRPDRKK